MNKSVMDSGLWGVRPIFVSAVALLMMTPPVVAIVGFVDMTEESPTRSYGPGIVLLLLPLLLCFGLPAALMGALFGVLPTLFAAEWTGQRLAARNAWWWVVVAACCWAAAAALLPAATGGGLETWLWAWPLGTAGLSAVALLTRWALTRGRPYWAVVAGGLLAAVAVVTVGSLAYGTGLVDEYAPPRVHASDLVGTWSDGHGGTLRLDKGGRATAAGTWGEPSDAPEGQCEGSGTWKLEAHPNAWRQRVEISAGDCWPGHWSMGGVTSRPKLNYEYGDPDSPDWYVLTRQAGQIHPPTVEPAAPAARSLSAPDAEDAAVLRTTVGYLPPPSVPAPSDRSCSADIPGIDRERMRSRHA